MLKKEETMKKISCLLIIILIGVAIDADAKKKARKFYLTQTEVTGSQALTACAKKFHMASLWEIFDTAALQYDTKNGFGLDDSGSGPPAVIGGWARTGSGSNSGPGSGIANCLSWTTDSGFGSVISLDSSWDSSNISIITPWDSAFAVCSNPQRVWCVQD
jgi:hypothetical protein